MGEAVGSVGKEGVKMLICYSVSDDCINIHSCGEICVRCGCCSGNADIRDRTIKAIRYYKERLEEEKNFELWSKDDVLRKVQEKNVDSNIKYYKRKIRMKKAILRTLKKKAV